jgi:mannose-1-phosphate guanylyltransferase
MKASCSNWSIVLAAGDGSRLASLTTSHAGGPVPKQFCSLRGGRTLLGDALARACAVTPPQRIVTVVAENHRPYWADELEDFPLENVLVQPSNRGTALGVLLPLLASLERDPQARIAILPSDHHVREEAVLRVELELALQHAARETDAICMLGLAPDSANDEYGWILPAESDSALRRVERFVEKPEPEQANELLLRGALWNSFILAGTGQAFAQLYRRRLPALYSALSRGWHARRAHGDGEWHRVYEDFAPADFSRQLLQGSEEHLRVLEVPPCGWTDLGTPRRVAQCLRDGRYGRLAPSLSDDTPVLYERLLAIRRRLRDERRQRA